ncbi:peptidoglycan-binding protein [Pararhizobium sp. BT-229]|uniref:peptidoglycan-binding domain-containing protein n=1 Tax=Pararhizobium sp. BT-229 TaxID=2986923 RepID=UPI003558B3C6
MESDSAPVLDGPDTRTANLRTLLTRGGGYVLGPIDGIAGKKTRAAENAFQLASGLDQSGEFYPPTVARLRAIFEAKAAA